ncbi:MAG: arsenate reductase ArsC [Deltaproteobacteria bacterium]|nr:arsenate reductase ArsC [Deltaproteobacteria bacterium]
MSTGPGPVKILFVCVGNTCRSQMGEGFARFYGDGKVEVRSAGTAASGSVNRSTIEAMKEIGIDISDQTSKQLTGDMLDWADVVVTMGCRSATELCPVTYRGQKYDWKIDDPLGRPWEFMQIVRDGIEEKVKGLISAQT